MMLLNKSKELIALERKFFYFVSSLFLFFVFFPYLKVFPIRSDTQPGALCLGFFVFILVKNKKLPRTILILLLPLMLAVALSFVSGVEMLSIRSILNYVSVFFISSATYFIFRLRGGFTKKWIPIVVYSWFMVGCLQTFLSATFAHFLLSRASDAYTGRGVIGLAPEPTQYACVCIFLMMLSYLHHPEKRLLPILLLIQILFFAKSSLAVLLLFCFGVYYLICKLSIKRLLVVAVAGYAGFFLLMGPLFAGTRLQTLLLKMPLLIENPWLLVLSDASILDRYFHIYLSIKGCIEFVGIPHGFRLWTDYLLQNLQFYGITTYVTKERIMSGYGGALFELGLMGAIVPISLGLALKKYFKAAKSSFVFSALSLTTLMFTPIPLGYPVFGFLIGYLCYYSSSDGNTH